jgi:hypothetical protein
VIQLEGIHPPYRCNNAAGPNGTEPQYPEEEFDSGFSKSFDTSIVTQQVLGGQTDKVVIFIDGKGNKYTSLPNPLPIA